MKFILSKVDLKLYDSNYFHKTSSFKININCKDV